MIVEAEHEVVGVEVEAPVFGSTVALGGTVAALIAKESDVGHKTETVRDIEGYAWTEADAILYGTVSVGASDAEVYATVDEEVDTVRAEIGVTRKGIDLEYGQLLDAEIGRAHV